MKFTVANKQLWKSLFSETEALLKVYSTQQRVIGELPPVRVCHPLLNEDWYLYFFVQEQAMSLHWLPGRTALHTLARLWAAKGSADIQIATAFLHHYQLVWGEKLPSVPIFEQVLTYLSLGDRWEKGKVLLVHQQGPYTHLPVSDEALRQMHVAVLGMRALMCGQVEQEADGWADMRDEELLALSFDDESHIWHVDKEILDVFDSDIAYGVVDELSDEQKRRLSNLSRKDEVAALVLRTTPLLMTEAGRVAFHVAAAITWADDGRPHLIALYQPQQVYDNELLEQLVGMFEQQGWMPHVIVVDTRLAAEMAWPLREVGVRIYVVEEEKEAVFQVLGQWLGHTVARAMHSA